MSGIARVLVDRTGGKAFDYAVPANLRVRVGMRVLVPVRGRKLPGTVVALPAVAEVADLKPLAGLAGGGPVLPKALLDLAHWIADYYCCGIEQAMKAVLPEVIRKAETGFVERQVARIERQPLAEDIAGIRQRAPKQAAALEALLAAGGEATVAALEADGGSRQSLAALAKAGWITITKGRLARDPHGDEEFLRDAKLELNPEQQVALDAIVAALGAAGEGAQRKLKPFLLHGVTGSGKTEVYLQALEEALRLGRTAIVLVPEISLTPQTVERFKSRFSEIQGEVAVLHSHLSAGERHDEWHKIHDGRARIVIGARSAVFAPLANLGLIIVDEEHESSYKQDETPRYNGRDIAVVRGAREGCVVVLGSATPSHESYHNALTGKYELIELPTRVDDKEMPHIRIIDMRLQSRGRKKEIISERLRQAIEERLERREQTILFLNRRGYSTSLTCEECGHVVLCGQCSLPMTFHRSSDRLVCHLCGHERRPPRSCPDCQNPKILHRGTGTEKVEEAVARMFPKARIARMDADTMTRKHAYGETLGAFRTGKIDILVGTQMIAKGLHFPNVTLVGIVLADVGLQMSDFRASERTFQLLTQVAGRAGRGDVKGEVFVQSFTPHHPAIQYARHHAYRDFHEQDDEFRRACGFPPHTHMILVTVRSEDAGQAYRVACALVALLESSPPAGLVIGAAAPAPIEKLNGRYRFHVTLRARNVRAATRHLRAALAALDRPASVAVVVDVDPLALL